MAVRDALRADDQLPKGKGKRLSDEEWKKAKKKRIEVFNDARAQSTQLAHMGKHKIALLTWCVPDGKPVVQVSPMDCLFVAEMLAEIHGRESEVGVLNMANDKTAGGGVAHGCRAQEEELCRRTNLHGALTEVSRQDGYPLQPSRPLVHRGVTVLKGGPPHYENLKKPFDITVFTAAAVRRCVFDVADEMTKRIDWLISTVERAGVKATVLSAWGCGAFGLDAGLVASLFKERLSRSSLREVTFAVMNDHNGENNYEVFRDAFA